jgi:hypothetical protein
VACPAPGILKAPILPREGEDESAKPTG